MPETATNPAGKSADEEINRLRARVRQLEAERSRRPASDDSDREAESRDKPEKRRRGSWNRAVEETADVARDLPVRLIDEAGKLLRGVTFGAAEGVRVAGDALNRFGDEVFERNQPGREKRVTDEEEEGEGGRGRKISRRRTIADLATSLPGDVFSAAIRAMDRSLDIPSASMDQLHKGYKEAEREAEPTLRDRRRDREYRSPISEGPAELRGEEREGSQTSARGTVQGGGPGIEETDKIVEKREGGHSQTRKRTETES